MAHYADGNGGDIEEAAADPHSDQPITPTSATGEEPGSMKDPEDDHSSKASFLAKSISLLDKISTKIFHFIWCILKPILWCLFVILIAPFIVVYIFITGDPTVLLYAIALTKYPIYQVRHMAFKKKIHRLGMATAIRLGCLALAWLVLNLTIPSIRGLALYGSLLWTWSLLVSLIIIGYPILVLTYMILVSCLSEAVGKRFFGTNIEYFMEGLSGSIMLVIYFTSILTTWLLCIDTKNHNVRRYGTLTLVSFLVGAILNAGKSIVLLLWKTYLIYKKYEPKILSAGCHLYFHLLIMDQRPPDSLQLVSWWVWQNYKPRPFIDFGRRKELEDYIGQAKWRENPPIEKYMLKQGAAWKHIDNTATYLAKNFELMKYEDTLDIARDLDRKFSFKDRAYFNITTTVREKSSMDENDSRLFLEILQIQTSKEKLTYWDFDEWMVESYKSYHLVGLKLKGAFEMMDNLNRVLTGSIVVLVILVWLFITRLATANVVVALASLFLGISFVFADACKAFFLGLTFTFVIHPYDVGDQCIIDNVRLLVKKVNILSTVFENQDKNTAIFPNLDLSTKNIVKIENELGWNLKSEPATDLEEDLIELRLHSSTTASQIRELQQHIDRCLEVGIEEGVFDRPYEVTVEEDGHNVKMNIRFRYRIINEEDASKKRKRRSKLFLEIKQFMDDSASTNQGR